MEGRRCVLLGLAKDTSIVLPFSFLWFKVATAFKASASIALKAKDDANQIEHRVRMGDDEMEAGNQFMLNFSRQERI